MNAGKKLITFTVLVMLVIAGCAKKKPPVARPMPPPSATAGTGTPTAPPPPPRPIAEPVVVPPEPLRDDAIGSKSLDDLTRESPLSPVFCALDSFDVSAQGQQVLQANAKVLKQFPSWQITIEGHCDERGTAEYNLALGERRALAANTYLV